MLHLHVTILFVTFILQKNENPTVRNILNNYTKFHKISDTSINKVLCDNEKMVVCMANDDVPVLSCPYYRIPQPITSGNTALLLRRLSPFVSIFQYK